MFSIFKPKKRIITLFEGGVDIHNHLLPGIDDGSPSVQDALEMINAYKQYGIHDIIATPHVMGDQYPNTNLTIEESEISLLNALTADDLKTVHIRTAAEYMLDTEFEILIDTVPLETLFENYILVEMSYFNPPIQLPNFIRLLKNKNYRPILAHPERYSFYHNNPEKLIALKTEGYLFQLNALSLMGHYGNHVQRMAANLLEIDAYDFMATDAHGVRHLKLLEEIAVPTKKHDLLARLASNTNSTFLNRSSQKS